MSVRVISFANQVGTGGAAISRSVAEALRFRYFDWEVTSQAANEAGVSPEVLAVLTAERAPSFVERIMTRLAGTDEEITSPIAASRLSMVSSDGYRTVIEHVVRQLAEQGDAVIVGHFSQVLLKDAPGVFRVMIVGSPEVRARNLAALQSQPYEEALRTVEGSDKQRADFFKRIYHFDWLQSTNYDLTINSDKVSTEAAVESIVSMVRDAE